MNTLIANEYDSLRSELATHQSHSQSLFLFGLTGTGAAIAFAVQQHESLACVAVPILILALSEKTRSIQFYTMRIASYINVRFDHQLAHEGTRWEKCALACRHATGRSPFFSSRQAAFWLIMIAAALVGVLLDATPNQAGAIGSAVAPTNHSPEWWRWQVTRDLYLTHKSIIIALVTLVAILTDIARDVSVRSLNMQPQMIKVFRSELGV